MDGRDELREGLLPFLNWELHHLHRASDFFIFFKVRNLKGSLRSQQII
jgi:hypothetical protein